MEMNIKDTRDAHALTLYAVLHVHESYIAKLIKTNLEMNNN